MQEHRDSATTRNLPLGHEALQRIDACLDRGELDQAQLLLRDLEMRPEYELGATYLATRLLYLRDRLPAAAVAERLRELLLLGPFPQAEALLLLAEAGCTGRELLAAPASDWCAEPASPHDSSGRRRAASTGAAPPVPSTPAAKQEWDEEERISERPTFVPDGPLYERTQRPTTPSPAPAARSPQAAASSTSTNAEHREPRGIVGRWDAESDAGSSPTIQVHYTAPPAGLTHPPSERPDARFASSAPSGAPSSPPSGPWSRPRPTHAGRYSLAPNSVERLSPVPPSARRSSARAPTTPSNTAPSNTAPSNTAPSNTAPSNTAPSNTAPSNTAPSNTAPSNTARSVPFATGSRGVFDLLEPPNTVEAETVAGRSLDRTVTDRFEPPNTVEPGADEKPPLKTNRTLVELLVAPEQPSPRHPPARPFRVPRPPQLGGSESISSPSHLALHEQSVERRLRDGQAREAQLRVRQLAEQALEPLTAPLGPESLPVWAEAAAGWLTRCPVLHYFGPFDRSLRSLTRLDLALLTLIPSPPAVLGSAAVSLLSAYVGETLRVTHHGRAEIDDTTALRIVTLGHSFEPHALVQQQLARNDTLLLLERLRAELAKPRTLAWSICVPLPHPPVALWDEPLDTDQLTELGSELRQSLWSLACARRWGQALDGSLASVSALQALLETLIPQVHTDPANEPWCQRVITLGAAYLGEILAQQTKGCWVEREEQSPTQRFVFQLPGGRLASPFARIAAALEPQGTLRLHTALEGWLRTGPSPAPRDARSKPG